MEITNTNIDYLFSKIKSGDILGFWKNGIFADAIKFFQTKDKFAHGNLDKICHVGIVMDVQRSDSMVSFYVSEQTTLHGGSYNLWCIIRMMEDEGKYSYKVISQTTEQILYWKSFDVALTEEQMQKAVMDAKSQIGKVYGFIRLFFSMPLVNQFVTKYWSKVQCLPFFKNDRVCSTHVWINMYKSKRIGPVEYTSNGNPTPEFVITYNKSQSIGRVYQIMDFTKCLAK